MPRHEETLTPDERADREDAEIRVIGRALIMSGLDREEVLKLDLQIARLTAGMDLDDIDHASPEFKAGAAEALSTVRNSILELKPTLRITEP